MFKYGVLKKKPLHKTKHERWSIYRSM